MAGIYFHVPFCKQACHYCDFHFSTNSRLQDEMVDAMIAELLSRKDEWSHEASETIYFGGGTPSLLNENQLNKILSAIRQNGNISEKAEITLEANPDDLNKPYLESLRKAGINRLSVGIQSLDDAVLKWMNRGHNSQQSLTAIENAKQVGFENISIDLIYGHPLLKANQWEKTLSQIIGLKIQHLSAYALTIEPKTVFGSRLKKGLLTPEKEQVVNSQFETLNQKLKDAGFTHYEVSNWSLQENISRHNSAYWKSINYVGIGPSAHSFDGKKRRWNISNNELYLKGIKASTSDYYDSETLTLKNRFNEYLMTRLRTHWGVSKNQLKSFGKEALEALQQNTQKSTFSKYLKEDQERYFIAEQDWVWADRIASELFWV